ncbi:MAG TPA: tRNA uridine-5-carboxymethylaminomethyl(34) synthesis GTPase MnmE [Gammaproteobacteria bacterium]|nr:tRNA uridine-5-carboxymethylaminomethyl(34) synthesis GTPase MnmE [Gammaproteobacteria bacterium]
MNDTIAAIATPPGRGGVGIVRVSGGKVKDICRSLTGSLPEPRQAKYTSFLKADCSQIDEGLCLFFPNPNSFTGEDVLEIQAHGGPIVLDMLLRRVIQLGARLARAGEFSERAFLNNKMDLVQVEAVAELINASSEQAAVAATRSLQGEFSQKINALVEDVTRLRIYVEAAIDFPEEEINFLADAHVQTSLHNLQHGIASIYNQAKQGALLSEGVNVVIVGEPNAGKSTLLNALTGEDTAIVTPIAGTTRDTIKAQINIDGVLLNIVDTAGLRETTDLVEQAGIMRAKQAMNLADLVLLVIDATEVPLGDAEGRGIPIFADLKGKNGDPPQRQDPKALRGASTLQLIVVYNKIDKVNIDSHVKNFTDHSLVAISAHEKLGIDLLREHIKQTVGLTHNPEGGIFLARRRHLDALTRAQEYISVGSQQLTERAAGELLAEELKHAQLALSEITGEFTSDDLLGRIFSEFCIGK